MNKKNNKKEMGRGWHGRMAGLLIAALFAIGFGWVGKIALGSLTGMLHTAWAARSWQPVPVEVLESRLRTSSDSDGATYAVQARYRYTWAGRSYESTRIGLDTDRGSDNIDGWHHAWAERLRAAREGGSPLTAWVDPLHPEHAVLDRQLRWRKLLFMLPFALLFPLVSIGACYAAWAGFKRSAPADGPVVTAPRHVPQHHVLARWLMAIFFCVMAAAVVGLVSAPTVPAWVRLIGGLFVLAGVSLLWMAVSASRRAWIYRGAFASFQPAQPRAGAGFQACWTLPPSNADPQGRVQLRVAQYRIDDSSSGKNERLAEHFTQHAGTQPAADGGLTLLARFELPADAPTQGARRAGERVDWRLEWLDERGRIVMAVPIPVQQANDAAGDAPRDRLARDAMPPKQDIPLAPTGDAMPSLPAGVQLRESADALVLGFGQVAWRVFGVFALIAMAVATRYSLPWLEVTLLALGLNALTRRWTVEVRDDGILLERVSWMWQRRVGLSGTSLPGLYHSLAYSRSTERGMEPFHALWSRGVDRGSDLQLTPGLRDLGAVRIAEMLRWAFVQRGGRFSPGELRDRPAPLSRPGWGWLICLLWLAARWTVS